ncbi:hypothetical protein Q664_26710 [Archangium violaceum Cb vi76]|uniref:Uncharacterized protein n=1 Tax=Archangium violaceum Cb vi76 TaxID=1406225 RepID=A0A084SQH6_9BACT|nr:hypothetical protein Q664_26710 [Archangium violaceum Cb vi76]
MLHRHFLLVPVPPGQAVGVQVVLVKIGLLGSAMGPGQCIDDMLLHVHGDMLPPTYPPLGNQEATFNRNQLVCSRRHLELTSNGEELPCSRLTAIALRRVPVEHFGHSFELSG